MDWSNMLPEILEIIAPKYIVYFEDYPSFAGVCESWHSAALRSAKGQGNGPPSRLPSLLLSEKTGDAEFREVFLLSTDAIHKIKLPEASGKICVSSRGWLATIDNDYSSRLINPFTRETINLPKADTFASYFNPSEKPKLFSKLVFLPQWSFVAVLWRYTGELAFCSIGDEKWTRANDKPRRRAMIMDITFYYNLVFGCDVDYNILAWDKTKLRKLTRMPINLVEASLDSGDHNLTYILGMDDGERKRLLVVLRKVRFSYGIGEGECGSYTYGTYGFDVWGYHVGKTKGTWHRVQDLGTKSLFVGHSSSFWAEQDPAGAIKANCIYFTDDVTDAYASGNCSTGGGRDMGIYHLSDGTIEPHFKGESHSLETPPIWLEPV